MPNAILRAFLLLALAAPGAPARAQTTPGVVGPDTVSFPSGALTLRGLVWRPTSPGPHPAVLYSHGSFTDYTKEMRALGPLYAARGYVFFVPSRRGQWLSAGQGRYIVAVADSVAEREGREARGRAMAELLEGEQMDDQLAALAFLKRLPGVDSTRIAAAGNSFGGILAVFTAARGPGVRAVVASAPAAQTWRAAPEMRSRLLAAAAAARAPIYFLQAENDYDLDPTRLMADTMRAVGRAVERKIYPAFGTTTADGHAFGYFGGDRWGDDVFAFLAARLGTR